MAYRRRQGITRASTFKEEINNQVYEGNDKSSNPQFTSSHSFPSSSLRPLSPRSPSDSLAAQAIRASAARRETPVFGGDTSPRFGGGDRDISPTSKGFNAYEDARNDGKGFWGVLAREAKAIIEDDNMSQKLESPRTRSSRSDVFNASNDLQQQHAQQSYKSTESFRRKDSPTVQTFLSHVSDPFERVFEEGRTIVQHKTADIIQETRKIQIMPKGTYPDAHNQGLNVNNGTWGQPLTQAIALQNQTNRATQLKASRDVAMATAAKAKLLLRELKTVKADLAFAKERCSQLEEENKILRESREKGGNPADDDLIRLQLETLLAEKARLAHGNSIYARENRFLREIVEYHQLTMQDLVYLDDDGVEEVSEIYPFNLPAVFEALSVTPPSPKSSASPKSPSSPYDETPSETPQEKANEVSRTGPPSSGTAVPKEEDANIPSASAV
ncbi:hypothetical protein SLE2022_313490 [Rubroshorea leprosula]